MSVYKSHRNGKLYILSYAMGRMTGRQLQSADYCWLRGQVGPWKKVPAYKQNDFYKVAER